MRKYFERVHSSGRVDRDAGMIYGVKLLGANSKNGRRYTADAMSGAVKLYDGKKVFIDHPEMDRMGQDRKFEDWAGVIVNPRFERGAIYGDIRLRMKSPRYQELVECAESFDVAIGMSHVAEGDSKNYRGEEVIESISEVYSVDIVLEPATTTGLYESETAGHDEAARRRGLVARVLEFLSLASFEELELLVVTIDQVGETDDQVGETENPETAAANDGTELRDYSGADNIHDRSFFEGYDCMGRPWSSYPKE